MNNQLDIPPGDVDILRRLAERTTQMSRTLNFTQWALHVSPA